MKPELEEILPQVSKPTRYLGTEWNAIKKDHRQVDVSFALAFPDVYEVGMSHLGSKILYHIINKRPDAVAERVYAPWPDMEARLREASLPLFGLETGTPLAEFDMVGFSLQYELTYTNVLNMLALGKIPLRQEERGPGDPFVIAGGPCAFNPEPLADFLDLVVLGEGEEVIGELLTVLKEWKQEGGQDREAFLRRAAAIPGIYVPSFYRVHYAGDGTIAAVEPTRPEAAPRVEKRVVADLDAADFPSAPVVPFMDIVHDRAMLELFRGCARGCRFCQAGMIYRPVRERSLKTLLAQAEALQRSTGYPEMSLTSLSSTDYSRIRELIRRLQEAYGDLKVSLPSLRVDSFSVNLAREVEGLRKASITLAPEAGSQRLRDVINKNVTDRDIEEAVAVAVAGGWTAFKLYFMIGLPTEEEEDLLGIARIAEQVASTPDPAGGRGVRRVTVSVSNFVPKPHTPFQWEPQVEEGELVRRQQVIRRALKNRRIILNTHDTRASFLEAVFARGDRRLGKILLAAHRLGCRFDGWTEHFDYGKWEEAFTACGIDPAFYALRRRPFTEPLPWDHLSPGVAKDFLSREYQRALRGEPTVDCSLVSCSQCGVCPTLELPIRLRGGDRDDPETVGQID
ncbi:MAG TPA: TIGR03960 family B12-binding radical SAM protein [Firmicutes bacterium]|nr:TIGR03960 family B12-binding radical SAM protein [Bacillota bacterium]